MNRIFGSQEIVKHMENRTLLRTPETAALYHKNPARTEGPCFICNAPIVKAWGQWKMIVNEFPYDAIARKHMMLVPLRHVNTWQHLTDVEVDELKAIKEILDEDGFFDAMFENFTSGRTFLPHYHLHLLQWKRS